MKVKIYHKIFSWLRLLSFFILIVFIFSVYFHNIIAFNQDLGRHLKIGDIILQTKKIPLTNLFSFTYPKFPFINHHWLSEVIFALFNRYLGLNSLIFLKIILNSSAFLLLLLTVKKRNGWIVTLLAGLPLFLLFSQRTEVRPEIFSYFFLSLYLIILNNQKNFKKYGFVLPLIQLFWVNFHIYFFLGPAILFFYLLSHLIKFKNRHRKELIKIILIFVSSSLACLFNPHFIKGALYPFFVFQNYGYQIVENQSILFMSRYLGRIYQPLFLVIFSLALISFFITLNNQSFYYLVSFSFFSLLGFQAIRNIPIFALGIFIPIINNLSLIKNKVKKIVSDNLKINFKLLFYFIFISFLLFLIFKNVSNQSYYQKLSSKRFGLGKSKGAADGVKFLLDHKISGPGFNNFDIGSYLIYRLYPQSQVFVDNRPEAYPAEFFKNIYIPMQENKEKWEEVNHQYHFNYIFFSHTDITPWANKFLKRMVKDKNWQLVFLDDYSIIFLRKNQQNKNLIKEFQVNEKNF